MVIGRRALHRGPGVPGRGDGGLRGREARREPGPRAGAPRPVPRRTGVPLCFF